MGTVHAPTSDPDSIDPESISVITQPRSVDSPMSGMIYSPVDFAAVRPVHFHPLIPGRYLMLFSERWYDATTTESDPGKYSSWEVDGSPGWAIIDRHGTRSRVGQSYEIPGSGDTLVAACSRINQYLYVLSRESGDTLLQHFRWSPDRDMVLAVASESVPAGEVARPQAMYLDGNFLVVVASSVGGGLYLLRKHWGRVGTNRVAMRAGDSRFTDDSNWEYWDGTGWSHDPEGLAPIEVTSDGLVSIASRGSRRYWYVTTFEGDGLVLVHTWVQTGMSFKLVGQPFSVGSVVDGCGMAYIQQHIPGKTGMLSVTAVPDTQSMNVTWRHV